MAAMWRWSLSIEALKLWTAWSGRSGRASFQSIKLASSSLVCYLASDVCSFGMKERAMEEFYIRDG